MIRSKFIGATILGTSFSWLDFPHYIIGCFFGWFLIKYIHQIAAIEK